MEKRINGIKGTHDFSGQETLQFNWICKTARDILRVYGFSEIILPIMEAAAVFNRGVGQTSDIVEKQMFTLVGRENDDSPQVVLRPEGTAQVIRYFLENSLFNQGNFYRFSYFGPMFRGERPQKGRLRQFHHIGAEVLGADNPALDAEIIILAWTILQTLGIKEKEIKLNTLGCAQDKQKFSEFLKVSLQAQKDKLCVDCQRRLDKNPLRVIDCKRLECKAIVENLSLADDHLCQSCKNNFSQVREILDKAKVNYVYSPYLVRGLDYYTNTVFEITSCALGSQDAIGAGGRYNNLVETMAGPKFPAIGFALGIERIMLVLGESNLSEAITVYVAVIGEDMFIPATMILNDLHQAGICATTNYAINSIKAHMRQADRLSAKFVVIVGGDELKQNSVTLKNMSTSEQVLVKIEELVERVKQ